MKQIDSKKRKLKKYDEEKEASIISNNGVKKIKLDTSIKNELLQTNANNLNIEEVEIEEKQSDLNFQNFNNTGIVNGFLNKIDLKDEEIKSKKKFDLTDEELVILRLKLKEKQKAVMEAPKIFLTLENIDQKNSPISDDGRPVIFITDFQHLILFALQGNKASYKPRWCKLLRQSKIEHVVVIIVDSFSSDTYKQHIEDFKFIKENFSMNLELVSPAQYSKTVEDELFSVSLSYRKFKILNNSDDTKKTEFTFENKNPLLINTSLNTTKFSKLDLILDSYQMQMEGYPLPIDQQGHAKDFVFTKDSYINPNEDSPMFSVDCEMVQCGEITNVLGWISIVDENLKCIYETYVKPPYYVTNYLTRYSGLTKQKLENITTILEDVQKDIRKLLPPDAILVGQALNNDLVSMKMFHPFIIDTSTIYNLTGQKNRKTKLKILTSTLLNREIQTAGVLGHNPQEDAIAAMELVLLKIKKGPNYGDLTKGWDFDQLDEYSNEKYIKNKLKIKNQKNISSNIKSAFFRQSLQSVSIFKIAEEDNKKVGILGFEDKINGTEIANINGTKIANINSTNIVENLKGEVFEKNIKIIKKMTKRNFITFIKLKPTNKRKSIRKVDKVIESIQAKLKKNTLFSVLFTGKKELDQSQNAINFINVIK